eukprot:3595243-Amphidinium_carterae.1
MQPSKTWSGPVSALEQNAVGTVVGCATVVGRVLSNAAANAFALLHNTCATTQVGHSASCRNKHRPCHQHAIQCSCHWAEEPLHGSRARNLLPTINSCPASFRNISSSIPDPGYGFAAFPMSQLLKIPCGHSSWPKALVLNLVNYVIISNNSVSHRGRLTVMAMCKTWHSSEHQQI